MVSLMPSSVLLPRKESRLFGEELLPPWPELLLSTWLCSSLTAPSERSSLLPSPKLLNSRFRLRHPCSLVSLPLLHPSPSTILRRRFRSRRQVPMVSFPISPSSTASRSPLPVKVSLVSGRVSPPTTSVLLPTLSSPSSQLSNTRNSLASLNEQHAD